MHCRKKVFVYLSIRTKPFKTARTNVVSPFTSIGVGNLAPRLFKSLVTGLSAVQNRHRVDRRLPLSPNAVYFI